MEAGFSSSGGLIKCQGISMHSSTHSSLSGGAHLLLNDAIYFGTQSQESFLCLFQASYPSGEEWAVLAAGWRRGLASYLQKHKPSELTVDLPQTQLLLCPKRSFPVPCRLEREVKTVPPFSQARELHFSLPTPCIHLPSGRGQQ